MVNLTKALLTAVKSAKKAGGISKKDFMKARMLRRKSSIEFVTKTDIKCEKAIIKIIKSVFPSHSIWSEERPEEKHDSEYEWIIDPLDGTHNFMKNSAVYGHSIALAKNKKPVVGVVYFPILNHLYTAVKGRGAFLNNKRIHVSGIKKFDMAGIHFFQHMNDKQLKILGAFIKKNADVRITGAATYHFCTIANGGFAAYLDARLKPGDIAAGILIVEEAGGRATNDSGAPLTLESRDIIVSNKAIHPQILRVLKRFKGL